MRLAVLLAGAVSLAAIASACSAPDPGKITFAEDLGEPRTPTGTGKGNGNGNGGQDGGGASTGGTDGTQADGGAAGTGGANAAVFGQEAFKEGQAPQLGAVAEHQNRGAPAFDPAAPTSMACNNCHTGAPGVKFVFGGRAFLDTTGTPAAGAEIAISDGKGGPILRTYADKDGYFWLTGEDTFPGGGKTGIRTKDKSSVMGLGVPQGSCVTTGCHSQTAIAIDFNPTAGG